MRGLPLAASLLLGALSSNIAIAQSFQLLQSPLGISGLPVTTLAIGTGVCVGDFDGDSDMDVIVAQSNGLPFRLYLNQGGLVFTDETSSCGLGNCGPVRCFAVGDIDNDGDSDVYVGNQIGYPHMFINDGTGSFVDEAISRGMTHFFDSNFGATFGDYNRDGKLDLYLAIRDNAATGLTSANILYRNEGSFFSDQSVVAGVDSTRPGLVVNFMDYNEDGWPDILVANDKGATFGPNQLFENNADGTFTDVSLQTNTNITVDGMGLDFLDVFNDGGVDFYCSDLPLDHLFQLWDPATQKYLDATATYGLEGGGVGWAVNWLDYDNDGWQDLHVVQLSGANLLFRNPAQPASAQQAWVDEAPTVGLDFTYSQYVVSTADFDDDGKVDILERFYFGRPTSLAPDGIMMMHNTVPGGNWIKFDAEGTVSNRDGYGARFEVLAQGLLQRQWVRSGVGYQSASDPRLHFGLGSASVVDQVKVTWPSGQVQYLTNVAANQIVDVVEPKMTLTAPASVGATTSLEMSIPGDEGLVYVMALSFSDLGTLLPGGLEIPITIDGLTNYTLVQGNAILPNSAGVMSAAGLATSPLTIPLLPSLSGLTFYATGVTFDAPNFPVLRTVFPSALAITVQ